MITAEHASHVASNPDGVDIDDLIGLIEFIGTAPAVASLTLYPELEPREAYHVVLKIKKYADIKAAAMRCRLDGRIDHAMSFEVSCENLYSNLPIAVRW